MDRLEPILEQNASLVSIATKLEVSVIYITSYYIILHHHVVSQVSGSH